MMLITVFSPYSLHTHGVLCASPLAPCTRYPLGPNHVISQGKTINMCAFIMHPPFYVTHYTALYRLLR
jgi:hypothetical protein